MAEATGRAAVLDDLDPAATPPGEAFEQLDLLGLPAVRREGMAVQARGPGRPPGARNRRTQEWADYLLARYTSPLETLAQIATQPVVELAARLGCSAIEALQEKRLAAIALLPYVHQRMPLAVDLTNHRVVHLHINDAVPGDDAAAEGPGMTVVGHVVEIMENQQVSEGDDGAV